MEVDKALPEKIDRQEVPRVPIKTYQWEDVRRSRKKGGYPWTHLTKAPYHGEEDPEGYTLEAYRRSRSRSTSTIGKARSESASTFGDRSPSPSGHWNENHDHSRTSPIAKTEQSPSGNAEGLSSSQRYSLNIIEDPSSFTSRYERSRSPTSNSFHGKIERSQSLNRDLSSRTFERSRSPSRSFSENNHDSPSSQRRSRSPTKRVNKNSATEHKEDGTEVSKIMENGTKDETQQEDTDSQRKNDKDEPDAANDKDEPDTQKPSEETEKALDEQSSKSSVKDSKRKLKRRLSVQSSYSRISLTKQSILDRIKSTRRSLKISRPVKRSKSDVTYEKKPINTKGRKSIDATKGPEKPEYIHIPLKPPPGQTDEFSYLEFEENPPPVGQLTEKKNGKKEVFGDDRDGSPIVGVILEFDDPDKQERISPSEMDQIISKIGNGASVQQIDAKDLFPEIAEQSAKIKEIVDSMEDKAKLVATKGSEVLEEVDVEDKKEALEKIRKVENGSSNQELTNENEESQKLSENKQLTPTLEPPRLFPGESSSLSIQELSSREGSTTPALDIPVITEPDEDNISQYLDKPDEPLEAISESSKTESTELEVPKKIDSQNDFTEITTRPLKGSDLDIPKTRIERARSEEPSTKKRKASIDSSYSRKSLSKLAFLKKFKNFADKIKFPSFGKGDKKEENLKIDKPEEIKKSNEPKEPKKKNKRKSLETPKAEEPKYIYIPLKPPEGETDEFSKFAEESPTDINGTSKQLERNDTETSEDSPINNVQIIILTPPSDEEVLDGSLPETPVENSKKFFDKMQIDNLKTLAKRAVDEVYVEPKALQTVQEEKPGSEENIERDTADFEPKKEEQVLNTDENIEKSSEKEEEANMRENKKENEKIEKLDNKEAEVDNSEEIEAETVILEQRILVDEEDGLKLSQVAVTTIAEKLAKEPLPESSSVNKENEKPVVEDTKVKKRVIFKKKKKTDDGEYEDVNIPDSQRSSLEIVKQDDDSKIKEDVELVKKLEKGPSQVDEKKWSKIDDHEYEPINPPPDEMAHVGPPQIHITSPQQQTRVHDAHHDSALSSTTSLERQYLGAASGDEDLPAREADIQEAVLPGEPLTPQELQAQIEDRFFSATTPETADSRTEGEVNTSQADSSTIETLPLKKESRKKSDKPKPDGQQGNKFNEALRHQAEVWRAQAGKIKTKFQSLKKPNVSLPQRPKFQAPSFKMPKIGDRAKIQLPTFKKNTEKRSLKERQFSTESNVGEPKKHFDFSTFPKIFDKHKKGRKSSLDDFDVPPKGEEEAPQPEFATVPRASRKKGPVGFRWANKFKDIGYADEEEQQDLPEQPASVRISLHDDTEEIPADASHIRFNEDIDVDEEYERENKEIHEALPQDSECLKRWQRGEFHEGPPTQIDKENDQRPQVTDLDVCEPQTPPELEPPRSNGIHSSGSLSDHRRGVIEEIDSDEFFLREKGISQENIEVGKYLTSEIREAFRQPVNSLSQIERGREFEIDASDQSLQEPPPRKKPIRRSRRKKTPQISQEDVSFDQDSITTEPEEYRNDDIRSYPPPARPKRRGRSRKLRTEMEDDIVPYQENIPGDDEGYELSRDLQERLKAIESDMLPENILNPRESQNGYGSLSQMYENEHMQGIEQPEIMVSDPYYRTRPFVRNEVNEVDEQPAPPPRKHRSLKSLNISEHDSILDDSSAYKDSPREEVDILRAEHEYIIPTPEPPARSKKVRSRSQSQVDDDRTSRGADSLTSENMVPVVEEICVKDIRDSSGYAIIDKQKPRDPPLPPSRFPPTPPKKRKSRNIEKTKVVTEIKFFTVPRSQPSTAPPERPSRNYSTLGSPTKPIRKKSTSTSNIDENEKENIDISQYIEIEEEPVKRLQSGEVIQKMRARPLPAPPRPPRRQRDEKDVFQDITNGVDVSHDAEEKEIPIDETEVSTQTEPLPEDFVCEPLVQEATDKVIVPSEEKKTDVNQRRRSFEETVTHAALVVQPLDSKIVPYSSLYQQSSGQERIVPTQQEESEEETSEVPEDFKQLKSPDIPKPPTASVQEEKPRTPLGDSTAEVDFLKTQKLQVEDLDVNRLRVNELQASKIMVSEIEGFSIQVNEINSRSGNLVVSGIEFPPQLIQELIARLQSTAHQQEQSEVDRSFSQATETESTLKEQLSSIQEETADEGEAASEEQKKTSIEYIPEEDVILDEESFVDSQQLQILENQPEGKCKDSKGCESQQETESDNTQNLDIQQQSEAEPEVLPKRPPRKSSVASVSHTQETEDDTTLNDNTLSSNQPPPSSNYSASASSLPDSSNDFAASKCAEAESTSKDAQTVDDDPPPRPPQPEYIPSQPPPSFYALRAQPFAEILGETIPMPPRRKRHLRASLVTQSSSEDNPSPPRRQESPEPSIPDLAGQLTRACATSAERSIKRLIRHFSENVLRNKDGKQDAHVMIIILLVLIAGILLLTGDPRVIIHHHHWEYFNPPTDL